MTPDQQTIAYIAFGIAALTGIAGLYLLISLIHRLSSKRRASNITGNVSLGDVMGDIIQVYAATSPDQPQAKKKLDWHKISTLILTFIATLSAVTGTIISVLTYLNGTP